MNQQEKFRKTVSILEKAYLNNTLRKGNCHACAVGNLVADALGAKPIGEGWNVSTNAWTAVFVTIRRNPNQQLWPEYYEGKAKEQIDATGYSWRQLARIENAFETAYPGGYYDMPDAEQGMYAGLMAVVDVLAQIHSIDLTTAEASKALFIKA